MLNKKLIKDIVKVFDENYSFFITGHIRPDGDTIGSELAISSWLKKKKKDIKVDVIHKDIIPENLLFLKGSRDIRVTSQVKEKYDVGIIFECPKLSRAGNIIDLKLFKKVINIDHHASDGQGIDFGDYNLIDENVSSCAEIVWQMMECVNYKPDREEAICLYTGLVTDTGKFQQPNTSPKSLQIAADLLKRGVNPAYIYQNIYCRKSVDSLKILGLILNTLTVDEDIAYLEITNEIYEKMDIKSWDTNGIINYAGMIPGVKVHMLFREIGKSGSVRVNFRAYEDGVDLNDVASHFGGGGHKHAAGCELTGKLNDVKDKVLSYLKQKMI
jgi:phosphoesterase RecJ-like protein